MRTILIISLACQLVAGEAPPPATGTTPPAQSLPTLLDLGSVKCSACKQMSDILDELRTAYPERLTVRFIDVNASQEGANAAEEWKIRLIPTLIFLDAAGKELFRQEGVMLRDDIVAKWTELKIDLGAPVVPAAKPAQKPANETQPTTAKPVETKPAVTTPQAP